MERAPELEQVVADLFDAMSSGSADAVEAFYSLDPLGVFVGTDDAEHWTDSAQHNADVRPFFDGEHGASTWEHQATEARQEGSTGWTYSRVLVHVDGLDEPIAARVTLVWHDEGGRWQVVHSHASTGN
jgi:ketosteroid isomerase-like protein